MQVGRFSAGRTHVNSEPSSESISALLGWIFQAFPPSQVDSGDVEHDPFEPEDHEKTLRERTVADAFSIAACLCGGEGGVKTHAQKWAQGPKKS